MKKIAFFSLLFIPLSFISQNLIDFDITTDQYPGETSWTLTNNSSASVVAGEDDYNDQYTTYPTVALNLPNGSYTFEILDSYGDGICCGFGNGDYALTDQVSGYEIASGGDFGNGFSVTFDLPFEIPELGCTDPDAYNYSPTAEADDGSCTFLEGDPFIDFIEVANGFSSPVDIQSMGDDRLFIVEQGGVIRILNSDYTTNATPFLDIDIMVQSGGEQGLLGLAFHPDYENNGHFFVHFTANGGSSQISRYTVSSNPDVADPNSQVPILTQSQPFGNHNAGAIAFGSDGHLYVPFGDGGSGGDPFNYSQTTSTFLGKMLRINVDNSTTSEPYVIPADNPYIGNPDYPDEIWSVGLRNPWRFSFDHLTGDMWIADVGQGSWEEIDFEPANDPGARNYGWKCYEGSYDFSPSDCSDIPIEDLTWPVYEFNHSGGACSVTGGYVYRGSEFPSLQGLYICTDYCDGLFRGVRDEGGVYENYELTDALGFGWTTFGQASNLDLYVAEQNGTISKIIDPCSDFNAMITELDGELTATSAESYVWLADGVIIAGLNGPSLTAVNGVTYQVSITNDIGCVSLSQEFTYIEPCEGDANLDGIVDILDLIAVSSDFGCQSSCTGDANFDGQVNVLDIVAVSSNFGNNCL